MKIHVWALTDYRPGTANQVRGVANNIKQGSKEVKLAYTRLATLPNAVIRHMPLLALDKKTRLEIAPPWPNIVVSAGRRAAPVVLYVKRRNPETLAIHVMNPGLPYDRFDLVVLPRHDNPPSQDNVLSTLGAPHALMDEQLFGARARLPLDPDQLPKPWTLLCLGGNTDYGAFTLADIERLVGEMAAVAEQTGTLLITASRRTPPAIIRVLKEKLETLYPDLHHQIYSPEQPGENPYHAWLAQAHHVIVTTDSVSMMSEAAYTITPLYSFTPEKAAGPKHRAFVEEMYQEGYVRPLGEFDPSWKCDMRLDEAGRIAKVVKQRLLTTG